MTVLHTITLTVGLMCIANFVVWELIARARPQPNVRLLPLCSLCLGIGYLAAFFSCHTAARVTGILACAGAILLGLVWFARDLHRTRRTKER